MTMRDFYRKLLVGSTSFAALLLSAAGGDTVLAQAPRPAAVNEAPQPLRNYLRSKVIRLPIEFNNQLRGAIQEIQLFCKENPAAAWRICGRVAPNADSFSLRLKADGEYAFTMVTIDKQGRPFPENVQQEPPGLIVVVDTQRPTIELTNLGRTSEGILIQCEVRDANLDLGKTQFSFQCGDKLFRPLAPIAGRGNIYCIPGEAVVTGLVRVSAQDLAGNHTVCEEHLNHLGKEQGTETAKNPPTAPLPQVGAMPAGPIIENKPSEAQPLPMAPMEVARAPMEVARAPMEVARAPMEVARAPMMTPTEPPTVKVSAPTLPASAKPGPARPHGTDEPRLNDGPNSVEGPKLSAGPVQQTNYREALKRQLVNSTKVFLDYQFENAATASKVEVWLTRDQGKTWRKHAEAMPCKSPVEVNLPGDGAFGVTLAVSNARGIITPPAAGDLPDGWIEVDTTKPSAQITKIEAAHEAGQHAVHIHWNVKDANLSDTPVDLLYAATIQGPWLSMAKGLKADGNHTWTPPAGVGSQVHVRLIARDTAGNESIVNSLEPVTLVEPARPRAILRGISTGAPVVAVPSKQ